MCTVSSGDLSHDELVSDSLQKNLVSFSLDVVLALEKSPTCDEQPPVLNLLQLFQELFR